MGLAKELAQQEREAVKRPTSLEKAVSKAPSSRSTSRSSTPSPAIGAPEVLPPAVKELSRKLVWAVKTTLDLTPAQLVAVRGWSVGVAHALVKRMEAVTAAEGG